MKKTRKYIVTLFFLIGFVWIPVSAATQNGETVEFSRKMLNATNTNYYYFPGFEYTATVPNAVTKLMYSKNYFGDTTIHNNLYLYETTVHANASIDFKQEYLQNTVNAKTSFYRKNSSGVYYQMLISELDISDWVYATITINDYNMNGYQSWKREAVVLHELLHAYGIRDLYNYANRYNIMYGLSYYWEYNNMSYPDVINQVLNSKYY